MVLNPIWDRCRTYSGKTHRLLPEFFLMPEFLFKTFYPYRYIVNFMLDSTLGLLIIWAGIRLAQYCARTYDIPLINFGEYGEYILTV